jgi:hypothetical protein
MTQDAAHPPTVRRLVPPLAFLGAAIIIVARAPVLFSAPRLWAEEGTRYFPTAFHKGWLAALLQVQHGYFALWPNLAATLAARLVPLTSAPLVTTLFAFLAQLIPVALILWGRAPLWPHLRARLLGVALYLLAPVAGEVWLNTINSQFYFVIITALILNEPAEARLTPRELIYDGLLALAGLTGPVSCFLAPLFIWRAWRERQRAHWLRAGLLVGCALIQATVILRASGRGDLPFSPAGLSLPALAQILWAQSVGLVLVGYHATTAALGTLAGLAGHPYLTALAIALLMAAEAGLYWFVARGLPPAARLYLLGASGLVLVLSLLGSLDVRSTDLLLPGNGGRYFFAPNVLLLQCIGQAVPWDRAGLARARGWLSLALVGLVLAAGLLNYSWPDLAPAGWPRWRDEVALYEADHRHPLAIWPLGWTVRLAP